jgi:hypothetical protein
MKKGMGSLFRVYLNTHNFSLSHNSCVCFEVKATSEVVVKREKIVFILATSAYRRASERKKAKSIMIVLPACGLQLCSVNIYKALD